MRIRGLRSISFSENVPYVLNNCVYYDSKVGKYRKSWVYSKAPTELKWELSTDNSWTSKI